MAFRCAAFAFIPFSECPNGTSRNAGRPWASGTLWMTAKLCPANYAARCMKPCAGLNASKSDIGSIASNPPRAKSPCAQPLSALASLLRPPLGVRGWAGRLLLIPKKLSLFDQRGHLRRHHLFPRPVPFADFRQHIARENRQAGFRIAAQSLDIKVL